MMDKFGFTNHQPFVDGSESIIDEGFHRAIFLAHFLFSDNIRCFAGTDCQIDEGNFTDTASENRIFAP